MIILNNESEMVITSMNMYEFSEKNNREMGVYVTKSKDKILFDKAVNETLSIIQSSEVIPLFKTKRNYYQDKVKEEKKTYKRYKKKTKRGYCIRCEDRISYNSESPYCPECYSIWAQFKNPEYEENFCHSCGEYENTSMLKPLCYDCFTEFGR